MPSQPSFEFETASLTANDIDSGVVSPASERGAIENVGGFLTPYYLFDLLERRHADELGLDDRDASRVALKRLFRDVQKQLVDLILKDITLERTWTLWYRGLFELLGFSNIKKLDEPLETERQGFVPISHVYTLGEGDEAEPLILIDLHPFKTDLDKDRYPNPQRDTTLTHEPISRALEFALDHNQARWALLSNGVELRLYRRGGSVARQYLQVDFTKLFDRENTKDWLVFWGLFRLAAFLPTEQADGASVFSSLSQRCLLDKVIEQSQSHATQVANDLRQNVVNAVENMIQGIIDTPDNLHLWKGMLNGCESPDQAQLKKLFEESIYFLYRLLFVLYAESRDLLPLGESSLYKETYSFEHLRDIADRQIRPEDYEKTYYIETLRTLFTMLYKGYPLRNPAVTVFEKSRRAKETVPFRIPPYNGRLFDPERTKFLDECYIPDRAMREVTRELSLSRPARRKERRERYSYAELGVDQLGSVYEGLLVYEPFIAEEVMVEVQIKGNLRLIPLEQADDYTLRYNEDSKKPVGSFILRLWGGRRKGSGSYYTPQEITVFLVKDALAPLVEPIIEGCGLRNEYGKPLRRADEILNLKVCDPAMGSGAFLVQACRYLGEAYGQAIIAEEQRENKHISDAELSRYKRRVAEKCLYGVDLNPLAVELAKVSVWLETLAKDRPLTFLDAHLRCGDALIGAQLRNKHGQLDASRLTILPTEALGRATEEDTEEFKELLKKLIYQNKKQIEQLKKGQLTLFSGNEEQEILALYERQRLDMQESDEDKSIEEAVALVHRKQVLLQEALAGNESKMRQLRELCNLWCAAWFWPIDAEVPPPTTIIHYDLAGIIFERPGNYIPANASKYLETAKKIADERRFFHWELEFPEVWCDPKGNALSNGGFDTILGNPPWEEVKPLSQEFWSNYLPTYSALEKQAGLLAEQGLRADPEIDKKWREYIKLLSQQANVFKQESFFTQQGGGDINTYKLFIEKMVSLTRTDGIFSFVIQSGIYTDKHCTPLRRSLFLRQKSRFMVSMENKKEFFPIHRSMKIVLLSAYKTDELVLKSSLSISDDEKAIKCLFLVGQDSEGNDIAPSLTDLRLLLPELNHHLLQQSIAAIKKLAPDTLTLMEFKNQQDVDITAKIYDNHPTLGQILGDTWNAPVRREFDRTNNSGLFNNDNTNWPLWEGKMIHQLDCDFAYAKYYVDKDAGISVLSRRLKLENYHLSNTWIADEPKLGCANFRLVFRKVGRNTDSVTFFSAILPPHHFITNSIDEFTQWTFLRKPQKIWVKNYDESNMLFLAGILNSLVLSFVVRQKVSANLSLFIVKQLPIPRLPANHPLSQVLVPLVARLTCVDDRFAPLWEEIAQFHTTLMSLQWSSECAALDVRERGQLRAEIDSLVADLYSLSEHDFAYILSTFPLLDRDQPALPGEKTSFITRDLTLLILFQRRGITPPQDIVTFFAEAGVDIRQRTGPTIDLTERVRFALQELGAVAYQPSRRERDDSNDAINGNNDEQEELDFDEDEDL